MCEFVNCDSFVSLINQEREIDEREGEGERKLLVASKYNERLVSDMRAHTHTHKG